MPSVVRVTNLDNGKSLVVRINDRGPYVSGRIIDMSRAGARLLGFKDEGIARVRVQVLTEQSLRLEQLAKQGQFPLLAERQRHLFLKLWRSASLQSACVQKPPELQRKNRNLARQLLNFWPHHEGLAY